MTMKLFKVTRMVEGNWDDIMGMIVIAESPKHAERRARLSADENEDFRRIKLQVQEIETADEKVVDVWRVPENITYYPEE